MFAVGLLLSVTPLPQMEFVDAPHGVVVAFPSTRPAAASEVEALSAAVEDGVVELGDRVVGSDPSAEEFTMIGVRFDRPPTEPVLVRVREDDGSWSEWEELEQSVDDGPDATSPEATDVIATEPLWVGSSSGYEVSVAAGDEAVADIALVHERVERTVSESVSLAEASAAPFPVRSRSAWNTRGNPTLSAAGQVQLAVVHHTATSNNYSSAQVPAIIRSMQAYHMDHLGWSDIGYNFVVDRFGVIWEARSGSIGRGVIGAHAGGFNTGSVGVSIIGNYVGVSPSAPSIESASRVVGWKLATSGVDPRGSGPVTSRGSSTIPSGQTVHLPRVVGHRDVGATSCPGSIYGRMGSIRQRSHEWYVAIESARNPVGHLDSITVVGDSVVLSGWAKDPDTDGSVQVHTSVGNRWRTATASRWRPDVAAVHPSYGPNRGFESVHSGVPAGTHQVCAYGINQGRGTGNTTLGCRQVVVK